MILNFNRSSFFQLFWLHAYKKSFFTSQSLSWPELVWPHLKSLSSRQRMLGLSWHYKRIGNDPRPTLRDKVPLLPVFFKSSLKGRQAEKCYTAQPYSHYEFSLKMVEKTKFPNILIFVKWLKLCIGLCNRCPDDIFMLHAHFYWINWSQWFWAV